MLINKLHCPSNNTLMPKHWSLPNGVLGWLGREFRIVKTKWGRRTSRSQYQVSAPKWWKSSELSQSFQIMAFLASISTTVIALLDGNQTFPFMAPPISCYRKPTLLTLSCRLYSIIARLNFDICTDFPNHSAFYCLPEEFRGIPEVDFHVGNVMVFMWYRAHYSINTGLKMFLMVVSWNWYHIACILAVLTAWSLLFAKWMCALAMCN